MTPFARFVGLSGPTVNAGWRSAAKIGVLFTLLAALPASARADTVSLFSVEGRADRERLEAVEALLSEILDGQGHTVVAPPTANHPTDSVGMGAAATAARADYVVTAEVEPLRAQYRLHIHVFTAEFGRLEELVATVLESEERERLSDILSSMVRRQGLGEDAVRLTDATPEDEAARRAEAEAAAAAAEAERLRQEELARQQTEAEAAAEAAEQARQAEAEQRRSAWDERLQYGADGAWVGLVGVSGRYAASFGNQCPALAMGCGSGGGLVDFSGRVGRRMPFLDGLELRGGLDISTGGAVTGIGLMAGATWQGSFLVEPIYVGAMIEAGVFFPTTGSRSPAFRGRLGPVVSWRPLANFTLEASPEIGVLTLGSGALTVGVSVRAGYRFD